MAMPMGARGAEIRACAKSRGAIGSTNGLDLSAGHARRVPPRSSDPGEAAGPTLILTARALDAAAIEKRRAKAVSRRHTAGRTLGALRHQDRPRCLPNILAKTEARDGRRLRSWLVDRDGFVTEGSLHHRLDRGPGGPARHPRPQQCDPARRHAPRDPGGRGRGPNARRGTAFHAGRGAGARARLSSRRPRWRASPSSPSTASQIGDGKPGPVTRRVQELYRRCGRKATRETPALRPFANAANRLMLELLRRGARGNATQ